MNKIYYYDYRVYIVHITFLSWAGYKLDTIQTVDGMGKRLAEGALQSLRTIHQEGVIHKDIREANMLFNPETNRVMIVDFERSLLLEPRRRALAQVVPNKRGWNHDTSGKRAGEDWIRGKHQRGGDAGEDILMAKSAFIELNWHAVKAPGVVSGAGADALQSGYARDGSL